LLMQMRRDGVRPVEMSRRAFEASEQAKARSLIDLLAGARASIPTDVEPLLADRERKLRFLLNPKMESQLRAGAKTADKSKADSEEIAQTLAQYRNVLAEIEMKNQIYRDLAQSRARSLEEIQRSTLGDDTLLLEYSLGERRSYVWLVSKDR